MEKETELWTEFEQTIGKKYRGNNKKNSLFESRGLIDFVGFSFHLSVVGATNYRNICSKRNIIFKWILHVA